MATLAATRGTRPASSSIFGTPISRRGGRALTSALLVATFVAFAVSNFLSWRATGKPAGLGATILEGWTAALFLFRRAPRTVSQNWIAWIAAPIGSFAMLLARPVDDHGTAFVAVGEIVQLLGVSIALATLMSLGRSFGLVAANRGVKTRGLYRLVRHPAYTGYLITYVGYIIENPAILNLALLFVSTSFQLVRIVHEEAVLRHDLSYRRYCRRVRHRLLPLVY